MLPTLSYSDFRKELVEFGNNFFSQSKTDSKIIIGKILKDLGTGSERRTHLQTAIDISKSKVIFNESSPKTFAAGTGEEKLCWGFYYYLHRNYENLTSLKDLDRSILKGELFSEVFGRTVNGNICNSKTLYGEEEEETSTSIPSAPFVWPNYVLKEKAKIAEKELSKGGGESIWLNPYNHYSIPFEGRESEIMLLDNFIKPNDDFLITYVIAPSGAGKTRLISQWMRKYVADPNDTEGVEDKIAGWDAGLVESRNAQKWKDWQPHCNTLIVIDYTYNYDEVIKVIAEKAKGSGGLKIRLLILDHVKPSNMSGDIAYGKAAGDSRNRGTLGDFLNAEHSTIRLIPDKNSPAVLSKIIARVATLFSKNKEKPPNNMLIQKATDTLLAMGNDNDATHHPLFAALMGQALGLNPDSDVTKLKRRDLIDQYFQVDQRIPWKISDKNAYGKNLGPWIGCYVCVATLLRGAELDRLHEYLPAKFDGDINKPQAAKIISQISSRLVADEDRHSLKPFEPDILGETFFLNFLDECKLHDDVMGEFYKMLGTFEAPEHEQDAVSNFLETIQRLVRNLINDDQGTEFSEDAWWNLAKFLDPKNFPENSLLRRAISISIGDVINQLRRVEGDDRQIERFANNLVIDDLVKISTTSFAMIAAYSGVHYVELILSKSQTSGVIQSQIFTILKNFYQYYNEPAYLLIFIAQEGCLRVLEYTLEAKFGTDINQATTDNGTTALMMACQEGHLDVVTLLLDKDADINQAKIDNGWTALLIACQEGHLDVVTLLLDKDADINQATTDNGWTALLIACLKGHLDVVTLLLDKDTDINQTTTYNGTTALMLACKEGHLDVVTLLLDKDADINQTTTDNGTTALIIACQKGHLDVVTLLLDKDADINQTTTYNGTTALMIACQEGHLDVVTLLLDKDADINQATTDHGTTALLIACQKGHLDVVTLLLDKDADINQTTTDHGNTTAMMIACQEGHLDVVTLLLDKDADINQATTDHGTTALLIACQKGHLDVLTLLLDKDADINQATTDYGTTALIEASNKNFIEVVKILIRSPQIDPNIQDTEKLFSALIFAGVRGHHKILSLLIQHKDINLDILTENNFTALHYAAALNKEGSLKLLLEAGANPTIRNLDGHTAAHFALQEAKNRELHDLLIQSETDWIAEHSSYNSKS